MNNDERGLWGVLFAVLGLLVFFLSFPLCNFRKMECILCAVSSIKSLVKWLGLVLSSDALMQNECVLCSG